MGIEIFRRDNWDRWMNDEFIRTDTRRLDRYKDRCLLEYIAVYGDPRASEWAVKTLGVSGVPVSVGGIENGDSWDKADQRYAVMHEQVMRETDYWVLEEAAYEAPYEIADFAFSRLTGCSLLWPPAPYSRGPLMCGLKRDMSRSDIEDLCREMIGRKGPFADKAAAWLKELPQISDAQLEEWAGPKTERSWDNDPTERLRSHSRACMPEDMIRSIYDAFIFKQYAGTHPGPTGLIMDETLDWFGQQVIVWYEKRGKRPLHMISSVRNVLTVCEAACGDLTDEQIRGIAYKETENKKGHSFYIGLDLLYGFEAGADGAAAVRYLTDAADAGNRYAVKELISIYEEGIGVAKNPWLAKKLREKYGEA